MLKVYLQNGELPREGFNVGYYRKIRKYTVFTKPANYKIHSTVFSAS
jgi:hypothetical protein